MSLSHKAQNTLTVNYRHSTLAYYVCVCIFRHGEYLAKYVVQFRRDVIQIFYKRVSFFCEIIFIILGTHLPRPIRNSDSQKRDAFVKYLHYIGAHLVYNCAVCVSQNSALPRGAVLWFRYKRYVTSHGPTWGWASESTLATSHHACPTCGAPLPRPGVHFHYPIASQDDSQLHEECGGGELRIVYKLLPQRC